MPDADESGGDAIEPDALVDRLAGAGVLHVADDALPRTLARARVRERLFTEREPPIRLERYVLLEVVGRGAMGVVFAAYDPKLDRKIALKVIRPESSRDGARQQLLGEAQALAKLAHPNVVAIHDVGLHDASVCLAMDLVEGETLTAWLAHRERTWREIVSVFLEAGRGLAAAHDVGLVHRDFKPDNVMIGPAQRVRVMDFGLATRASQTDLPAGTPLYMAPEQHDGVGIDAKSDQFGYCATLWHALFGEPPFRGSSFSALAAAKLNGNVAPPATRAGVPAHLEAVLRRGLAARSDDRFVDMHRLLDALAHDPVRSRNRWLAAAAIVAIASATAATIAWDGVARSRACDRAAAEISRVWNEDERAAIGAAFRRSPLAFATTSWERIEPVIDDHARRWSAVRESSCRAATVSGTRDVRLAARADECMLAHRDELASWLEVLGDADDAAITTAIDAAAALADPEPCDDDDWLAERPDPPGDPELFTALADASRALARARAFHRSGRIAQGQALVDPVVALDGQGFERVRAEALLVHAALAETGGDTSTALSDREAAIEGAFALGDDRLVCEMLSGLISTSTHANRLERSAMWAELAPAFLSRVEPTPGLSTASVASARARLALARDHRDESVIEATRALELYEQRLPAGHPSIARAQLELALLVGEQGDHLRSLELLEEAERRYLDAFGADHPEVEVVKTALGDR